MKRILLFFSITFYQGL